VHTSAVLVTALRSLRRSLIRSSLTALGVVVGVAAVVATLSIGDGAKASLETLLARPASRIIQLRATPPVDHTRRFSSKLAAKEGLTVADYYELRRRVGRDAAMSPRIMLPSASAAANGRSDEIVAEGIDIDGFVFYQRTSVFGSIFSDRDVRNAANICVLSKSLSELLFPIGMPPRAVIQINGVPFVAIGVVNDMPFVNAANFRMVDLHAYIPFTSLLRRLDSGAEMSLEFQVHDIDKIYEFEKIIADTMEEQRSGRKAAFITTNSLDAIAVYADSSRLVARLLAIVAAISLVVGGIGIMNIMLVNVRERTQEIGVRMAVGTRPKHVLAQFLVEATVLSVFGGTIGAAAGIATTFVISRFNAWPVMLTSGSLLAALACSSAVGLLFGYHPARRAGLLQPIDALRNES
jgi:putative ABC transport system permease protein